MQEPTLELLSALSLGEGLEAAARRCGTTPLAMQAAVAALEQDYRLALVDTDTPGAGLTPAGRRLMQGLRGFQQQGDALRAEVRASARQAAVLPLLQRRSVSPKRLKAPAPSAEDIGLMLQAALRGPDHGGLRPWRVIGFGAPGRQALADLFEAEKRRRDPLASGADLLRARDHATRAPALLAFVIRPQPRHAVPVREQWLAAGAALGNLLNAAHQLGFGASILSGERCFDADLVAALGLQAHEALAGFISLGTVAEAPPAAAPGDAAAVYAEWSPHTAPRSA